MTGSNRRPSACKADALPAELILHRVKIDIGDPYGIRTRVTAVKGRCLNRLTNGPCPGASNRIRTDDPFLTMEVLYLLSYGSIMAPQVGFEPTTDRLTADCSTTELLWNIGQPGNVLLLQGEIPQLPSALKSLTSVFGMGTGVTSSPSLPD
jgi:hypothetical protein